MSLPITYQIKTWKQKSEIVKRITDKLCRLEKKDFPNIWGLLENDNSKVEIINIVITSLYSEYGSISIDDALRSFEITNNE
tara:strand:+ start:218 stop:460 length:243 start_codon:yes stop_codon:yes gene_type:complete